MKVLLTLILVVSENVFVAMVYIDYIFLQRLDEIG